MERPDNSKLVLYADDDADDRMLLSDTFQTVAPHINFETVADGYEVLSFLQANDSKLPCLLILDLNMPGMSGKEVMHNLRDNLNYQKLPIVIFTTSSNPVDKDWCDLNGIEMITKPMDFNDFEKTASRLLSYCR